MIHFIQPFRLPFCRNRDESRQFAMFLEPSNSKNEDTEQSVINDLLVNEWKWYGEFLDWHPNLARNL